MKASLAALMKEDFARYTELHYLQVAPSWRKCASAVRHRGLRTIWYFRLRRACSTMPWPLRIPGIVVCMGLRLLLWPSGSCEIPAGAVIGGGCFLPHPVGIVLAPQCRIGTGASIFSGVVLGINHMSPDRTAPTLGNDVTVYAGAKVIGGVALGDRVVVGANAVVNTDIASCTVVAGVPARPVGTVDRMTAIAF